MAAWVKYGESAPEQVADELDKAVVAQDKRTYREMLSSLFKLFWGKFFQRVELHRRCLTLPICAAFGCAVCAFVLLLVYFAIYMLMTPQECLQPEQWYKIWRDFL